MLKKVGVSILLVFLLFSERTAAQGIEGTVKDSDGSPVPYASIFIRELTRGTTTNSLGIFSLPLPPGQYTIYFRSLGYTEITRDVTLGDEMTELNIILPPQTYMIPEVQISATGEDPAYRVMRKAIGLANYHLNQVSEYRAEIYIKGTAYFHKLPRAIAKRIEVADVKFEENRAYMMESLNDVTYRAPDKYEQRVLASQNTIPGNVERVNPMDYINASLYQPQIESFVSPLARNAFFYYKFSFEGSFLQGSFMIDKIKVTPKRKSQQLCSGFLYIVEDLWCLHSSDLAVNTIAGTLFLEQQYANTIMDAWMPVSHKLKMDVEFAGVRADVTYVASLKYTKTELNANLPKSFFEPENKPVDTQEQPKVSEEQQKIEEILEKDELNDRDMARLTKLMEKEMEAANEVENKLEVEGTKFSVAPNAVMNDSVFWSNIRPVPLTFEEKNTLVKRDSALGTGGPSTQVKRDSLSQPKSPTIRGRDLLVGKTFRSKDRKTRITYGGLFDPSMLSFNTVDGFIYGQEIGYDYRPTRQVAYRWNLQAGYAFARKSPDLRWVSDILYAPAIRGKIALNMRYKSEDFNDISGIPSLTNSAYSLFYRENLSKRYEVLSAQLEHRMDLATGLVFYATLDLRNRRELDNTSDFSFFFSGSKAYTPNHPADLDPDLAVFDDSKLLAGQIRIEYTYEYYYRLQRERKQYFKSDYPTVYGTFRYALPVGDQGWARYSLLYGGLMHEKEVGLLSTLDYQLEAGYFINNSRMHFSDYMHFKSSPLLFDMAGLERTFLLLDHYRASTSEHYVQAHARLTSPYMLLKMLPWFSERLWNESIGLSYLYTPGINHHIQLGYSLNEIGFLFDIGIYTAFEDWKYFGTGLRINWRF